jgi:inositol oxygenase
MISRFSMSCAKEFLQYLYNVFKHQSSLPREALAMIRYHSFYPWHRDGAYRHLMNDKDGQLLSAVQAFNRYDSYSKYDEPCDIEKLRLYYQTLISKFFPSELDW